MPVGIEEIAELWFAVGGEGGGGISTQADTIIMDCLSNHLTPNICAVNRILELNICSQSSFVYGQNDKIR